METCANVHQCFKINFEWRHSISDRHFDDNWSAKIIMLSVEINYPYRLGLEIKCGLINYLILNWTYNKNILIYPRFQARAGGRPILIGLAKRKELRLSYGGMYSTYVLFQGFLLRTTYKSLIDSAFPSSLQGYLWAGVLHRWPQSCLSAGKKAPKRRRPTNNKKINNKNKAQRKRFSKMWFLYEIPIKH